MKAVLFQVGNDPNIVTSDGEKFSLTELQKYVGGYIESYPPQVYSPNLPKNLTIYVNEEAILKRLNYNRNSPKLLSNDKYGILGNCIIVREEEGKIISLTTKDITTIEKMVEKKL